MKKAFFLIGFMSAFSSASVFACNEEMSARAAQITVGFLNGINLNKGYSSDIVPMVMRAEQYDYFSTPSANTAINSKARIYTVQVKKKSSVISLWSVTVEQEKCEVTSIIKN